MKLFLAAPESFLPSALTAFGSHACRLHFFRKLLSAAPASGLPFLSTALLAHVSCAITGPIANAAITAAKRIRFMVSSYGVNLPRVSFHPDRGLTNSRNARRTCQALCEAVSPKRHRCLESAKAKGFHEINRAIAQLKPKLGGRRVNRLHAHHLDLRRQVHCRRLG